MNFIELAKKRYSVRSYSSRKVEKEILNKILEAGNIAPTAKNQQPQRIYVVEDTAMLAKLDTLTPCRYNAPTVLIFTYDTDDDWKNPNEAGIHSGIEDVSIVATHIMLQAAELGLGTTWCNMFGNTALEEAFDLPANEKSVLFMDLGYAAEDAEPSPGHTEKKPLADTVRYLK
ncbi:nitroreductase family protein [bacterium]|nr:nitroreductase family protein [bacterium]